MVIFLAMLLLVLRHCWRRHSRVQAGLDKDNLDDTLLNYLMNDMWTQCGHNCGVIEV
jgi:hypothetical protein